MLQGIETHKEFEGPMSKVLRGKSLPLWMGIEESDVMSHLPQPAGIKTAGSQSSKTEASG